MLAGGLDEAYKFRKKNNECVPTIVYPVSKLDDEIQYIKYDLFALKTPIGSMSTDFRLMFASI